MKPNPLMTPGLLFGLLFVFFFSCLILPAAAHTCKERREAYYNLPAHIGSSIEPPIKVVYPLYCDTVEVPAGATTRVEAGAMLSFARAHSGNAIKVSGTLILKGNKDTWVFLSGSIDSTRGKLEPGKATWSGIVVEPGGKLTMEFAGVWGAPTPITAFSQNVTIKSSFFTGSTGIFKPDGSIMDLEPTFAAVNDVDFSKQSSESTSNSESKNAKVQESKPGALSAEEKEKLLAHPVDKPFWTAGKFWGLTGLILAGGGGATYYYFNKPTKEVELKPVVFPALPFPGQ